MTGKVERGRTSPLHLRIFLCPWGLDRVVRAQVVMCRLGTRALTGSNTATDKSVIFKWRKVKGRPIVYRISNHAPSTLEDFLGYIKMEPGSRVERVQPWVQECPVLSLIVLF